MTIGNKAVAKKFFAALSSLDTAGLMPMLAPNFVIETTGKNVISGIRSGAEVVEVIQAMSAMVPNGVRFKERSMTAEENRVACQLDGEAVTFDGRPYNNQYMMLLEFANGKIARMTEYMDSFLVEQMFGDALREKLGANAK